MSDIPAESPFVPPPPDDPLRVALVGCGGMARHHVRTILPAFPGTEVVVTCEPAAPARDAISGLFTLNGRPIPPNEPDLAALLARHAGELDAAFIITPHACHHDQAVACMEAGLDVLLEKPMVLDAAEAVSLIRTQRRTGRRLVVAFQGSLSPEIRTAAALIRAGELGRLLSISATVWQNWAEVSAGTWRMEPAEAGGGFLFDTGAHMLNTVADLAGEPFVEVSAWLADRGQAVETMGSAMARTASGTLVTLHGCGETVPACTSEVLVFGTEMILRTGIWGRTLDGQRRGEAALAPLPVPRSLGVWEQFLAVRRGDIPNPSPPEIGLRMARLWDAIRASAAQGGRPVQVESSEL